MAQQTNHSAAKETFWRSMLEKHRASELSVRAFCRREGISEPSFYAWRKEIGKRDVVRDASQERQPLIPVNVVRSDGMTLTPQALPRALMELVTPSGFTLRFHQDCDPRQLDALLSVVSRCQDGAAAC